MGRNQLKPCPFCGSDNVKITYGLDAEITGIFCYSCKALMKWAIMPKNMRETFVATEAKWIEKYNRRPEKGG